eukprot:TRINITY_DN1072_c2_g3_i1.p1 TRINITY_DN1072_c2_g3~~TRINITY_DN1072_c2_g3_i1.p1  ORF type:complete len:566 (+),score=34.67 TRINITY_DN1072_c2_g3_i1:71-1768(+)
MSKVKASWMPDTSTTECRSETCLRQFGLFVRRHHCRACGGIFCSSCTAKRRIIAGGTELERVCDTCAADLDATAAQKRYIKNAIVISALNIVLVSGSHSSLTKSSSNHPAVPPSLCNICYGRCIDHDCPVCGTRLCTVCSIDHPQRCTKGEGYKVTVMIHEVKSAGSHDLTKPSPCVLISSEYETVRTTTKPSSCSHYYGEEFNLTITDATSSLHFKVVDDRTLHYTVIGRACVPLSTVSKKGLKNIWLELLPDDPKERKDAADSKYRSATRASPMKKPKHPLGWLCVSIVSHFDLLCYFKPPVPPPRVEEFTSTDFMVNISRLQVLWNQKTPTLLVMTQGLPDLIKFGLVIPLWGFICSGLQVWSVPLLCYALIVVNGVLSSKGTAYQIKFSETEIAVYEDDVQNKEGVTAKLRSAYNAAHELPVVLRRIQMGLGQVASSLERFHTMFSFHDLSVSVAVCLALLLFSCLLSVVLFVFPVRFVFFLVGFRVIIIDNKPPNPNNPFSVLIAAFKSYLKIFITLSMNLWGHLPDALELEHRAIAAYQVQDGPPSAYHTKRQDSVRSL